MKTTSNKQLRRKLLCALVAGALAAPFAAQTAYALPIEGANATANAGEANITTADKTMNIVGKTEHNILKWEDFSVEKDETVKFDGGAKTRDYLNLVTGEGASNIYGKIEGGRNVYLVNPHGILFAKGSEVNTGALYLSTANPADIAAATNTFKANGTSPLSATAQMGDVLNLGTVKASKLYIEGKNVKVLNTDAVTDTNGTALTGTNVTIRSEETPHIGYDVANTTTRNFTINGSTSSKMVSDYASTNVAHHAASAKSRGWDVKKLNGTDAHTDYDYMRVHDVYELQHMDANRVNAAVTGSDKKIIGRYMLANDIAASETQDWDGGFQPIGSSDNSMGAFTGRFDGVGHTITGLTIKPPTDSFGGYSRGMFAYIEHAIVENVSLKGASVSGEKDVGGIVGAADYSCVVRNVSFSGEVYGSDTVVGGIVGTLQRSTLENVYHEGTVEGHKSVGGIVGYMIQNSTVQNVRNAGKVLGNEMLGGIAGSVEANSRVQNAVQMGTVEQRTGQTDSQVGGVVGLLDGSTLSHAVWKEGSATNGSGALIQNGIGKNQGNTTVDDVQEHSLDDMKKAATYAKWGSDVATEGGKRTPWRIYDGKTMPLLKAFLRTKHLANRESVYDGTAPTIAGGDGITWTAGKDAGTYHAYSEQYDIIGGAYTVKPKELTLGFTSGTRFDKTYDGGLDTATRTLTKGQHYNLGGFVGSDGSDVELAGAVTGKYADKNAGRDKEVTFQNLALTGTGAKNYTITRARGVGTITPKQLTLDLVGGTRFDKTYDGNANVTQSLTKGTNYTLTGFVGSEGTGIALASSTGTYSDKNAAADKTVTFNGLTLTGTGARNYTLDKTALTGIGTIARRALTLGAVAAQSKTYDGTTAADASKFGAALTNAIAGDDVKATATGAAYNDKNVAGASRIDYTGVGLAGSDAGNYTLAATTAQGAGTIAKRALTIGTVGAQSKTYNGNTAADASKFHATLGNLVAGEENLVTATAAGATYNDKNVAGANKVTYTGVQLTGTGAGNYSIANTAQGAGRITPKQLNLALTSGARFDKTYDGNNRVDQSLTKGTNYTLTGFVGTEGDHLALAAATGTYTDKNAAADKAVTFGGLTLTGTGAGNYTLNRTTLTGTGTIAPRALTLAAVAGQTFDKVYDGTTNAGDALKKGENYTLSNFADGEGAGITVTSTGTGSYADKNVGTHAVNYTGLTLTGAGAGNYRLNTATLTGTGTITPRTLTLTADAQSIVQGAPLPSFTGRADGFADGEDERVFGADGITFGTTLTNTDTPGSYGVTGRIGSTSDGILGNYRIGQAAGNATAFTIHAAALPGGLIASLVQNAAPRFDMGFEQEVYVFGLPRPIPTATLGIYRFAAARDISIEGVRLD
ncbi:filamentous hemagglutinin [Selenomonas sp. oral taxon 126]|uniref:YDG domain-containing protein n=1 Tax=Selenomonas sp. oral taxon 126 TaxID=712528 RepID=UPI0008078410|nr:YDG domain-containing protein [Selenomonas sp. oral taxon 126]ANR71354.1 filamentous hemagglutinin [Selenomonas sp. oral taxon 126]